MEDEVRLPDHFHVLLLYISHHYRSTLEYSIKLYLSSIVGNVGFCLVD